VADEQGAISMPNEYFFRKWHDAHDEFLAWEKEAVDRGLFDADVAPGQGQSSPAVVVFIPEDDPDNRCLASAPKNHGFLGFLQLGPVVFLYKL
jgi:hypothetical protein